MTNLSPVIRSASAPTPKAPCRAPGCGALALADPFEEESVDDFSESSDPVRLYLKEMGKIQLLTREGEMEVAKRIEAGEKKVEEEILKSPVMLDYIIRIGEQVKASDVDLHDVFEDNDEAEAVARATASI